jgi:hypothetical protein
VQLTNRAGPDLKQITQLLLFHFNTEARALIFEDGVVDYANVLKLAAAQRYHAATWRQAKDAAMNSPALA